MFFRWSFVSSCVSSVSKNQMSRGAFGFGYDYDVELVARAFDNFDHIVVRPVRVGAVDAHGANLFAPIEIAQRFDSVLARRFFLRRRDRIFKIEENHVGRGAHRLLDHFRTRSRRRKFGSS